jgi:hypothetical protein
MTFIPEGVDTAAFYGSVVRGDHDRFSDRDLLLVSNDESALTEARIQLSALGYSCACYDWNKMKLLADKKALFIQHLKQETRIIVDRDNRLQSLLATYSPASSYSSQINAARSLVSLTECFPDTPKGIGWALDVLTIGFRNLSILSLANEGNYTFSFVGLVSGIRRLGLVDQQGEQSLLSLRRYKSCFRKKQFSLLPQKEDVFRLQRIVGESFDATLEPRAVSEEYFNDYCLHSRRAAETAQWYLKARLYEGAFLTLNRPVNLDLTTSARFEAIEDAITNPACYNALFSDSAEHLRVEVMKLVKDLGLKAA